MQGALIRAMEKSVADLERESKALAPYDTGELEGSVQTDVQPKGSRVQGSVEFDVPYAARQNFDLSLRPGPGTQAKAPTKYGTPGPNYLTNPHRGLGDDGTYQKHIEGEVNRL